MSATGNPHGVHGSAVTEKRRKLVADMMYKRGMLSQKKIMDALRSEFGVVVSRETVARDMKSLSGLRFDDEMRSFDSFIYAKMKRNYIALEELAERARVKGDIRIESDVRKKLSTVAREYHDVCHKIFEADKRSSPKLEGSVPESFSFGSVETTEKPSPKKEVVD